VPAVALLEHGNHHAARFLGEPADRLQTRPVVKTRGNDSGREPPACEHALGLGQVHDRPDLEVRKQPPDRSDGDRAVGLAAVREDKLRGGTAAGQDVDVVGCHEGPWRSGLPSSQA
jgi:hypothetical protein